MIDRQQLYPKLEKLGPAEVRRRLAAGEFGAPKIPVIEEWLQSHESSMAQERHDQTINRMDTGNIIANRANLYAKIALGLAAFALLVELILHWPTAGQ
jgi:hypothetical protein